MLRSAATLNSELRRKRDDMEDNKPDCKKLAREPGRRKSRAECSAKKLEKPLRVRLFKV